MLKGLYSSPLRVYLCLAALALAGLIAGMSLPVSLFPNSSKPRVRVNISYGSSTATEFLDVYGRNLEGVLAGIKTDKVEVERTEANYDIRNVKYNIYFKWGVEPRAALREVQNVMNGYGARFPVEMRDSIDVQNWNQNSGFFAASFYSESRSLDEVYDILEPIMGPQISKVSDAEGAGFYNPNEKEIRVEMNPSRMAALQLVPRDVDKAINLALEGNNGGSVTIGTQQLSIQMPRLVQDIDGLARVVLGTPSGQAVHLGDIAKIDFGPKTSGTQSFRTNGAPSLILFGSPKPGGNVKRMSEDLLDIIHANMKNLPKDIQFKVLVDPSEFIRDSITNVFHEVLIGALLAVVILFVFIGSFKNVVTAAVEIPLSMILAFILMKFSGMNLNLISLGGLALSAGMNVDASVVVMENIFRHFDEAKKKAVGLFKPSYFERLEIISQAVREVSFPVIASTIASLVVFVPLAFTSDLSYAVLGDLAKTVVFSHGFSMFVALILVPTVRLQLMSADDKSTAPPKEHHSPIEKQLTWLETTYGNLLEKFIRHRKFQFARYASLAALLVVLTIFVLPRLPKEIIGKPDTDWMTLSISTHGNTLLKQMESKSEIIESRLLAKFGPEIQYTFTEVNGTNDAWLMARIKDKSKMADMWKRMEAEFPNTPFDNFHVDTWNPAELPIPDPPQLRIAVRGGEVAERARVTQALANEIEEKQIYPRNWADPDVSYRQGIRLISSPEQWATAGAKGQELYPSDLADMARVATTGRRVAYFMVGNKNTDVVIRYPEGMINSAEDIAALPLGIGSKLVPLKALANVRIDEAPAAIYREDQRDLFLIFGKESDSVEKSAKNSNDSLKQAEDIVNKFVAERAKTIKVGDPRANVTVIMEDAQKDMNEALRQLGLALALSIALIFLTLMIQFGSLANALLVMVAVPLGFIGVLISLFVFRSTLSLNSVLGVILLNGISVANSILIVDFLKRKVDEGMSPIDAAVAAGRTRLRPILITSLTSILGMLPVAMGLGEGGRILQPLGIAVSGGLWVSMGLTLFIAPALQVLFLKKKDLALAAAGTSRDIGQESQVFQTSQTSQESRDRKNKFSFGKKKSKQPTITETLQ
jgi:HAE1 family hydrophobic/amphiphilic exporter-1